MGNTDGTLQGLGNPNQDDPLAGFADTLNALNSLNQQLQANMTDEQKQLSSDIQSAMLGGIFNPSINDNLFNINPGPSSTNNIPKKDIENEDIVDLNMDIIDKNFTQSAASKKLLIYGYFHEILANFDNNSIDSVIKVLMRYVLYSKDGKLIIKEKEKLILPSNDVDHPYEYEEIIIKKGGKLTTNPTTRATKKGGMLFIKCMKNITISKTAKIDLKGLGWPGGYGDVSGGGFYEERGGGNENGMGPGGGKFSGSSNNHCSAAGNGSYGTCNYCPNQKGQTFARNISGKCYGDQLLSVMHRGSGGATSNKYSGHAGSGGGSLWIYCQNDIVIDSCTETGTVNRCFCGYLQMVMCLYIYSY